MTKQKVLIVDDTNAFLLILNSILKADYEVLIATNGEDALAAARAQKPDLVLLDIIMPGMTGFEVLEIMRNDAELKDMAVIMITGKVSPEHEEKGRTLGAADYIKKPFQAADVKMRVDSVIKKL